MSEKSKWCKKEGARVTRGLENRPLVPRKIQGHGWP